jgi:hypothetical protein
MSTQQSDTSVVAQVPAIVADPGKVRLGGAYPSLTSVRMTPATIADTRKVRLGGACPAL